mmetsp:Transcript_10081/g.25200  ORF Transcript_10081/g.25200 Transcript_10081/m.25200 type:complete len:780 (-) Transcript_10081:67-2406(-)
MRQPATSNDEESLLLEELKKKVNVEAFYMKRALDADKLMDSLKHSSNMIAQLRTGDLSPRNYYDLYILAVDHIRHLEAYLSEQKAKGERIAKLYELVQYAGNILPRLYLLITVGSVFIKTNEKNAKEILSDLTEMCKGVQHPTRGLFLRNYLSEMTKDKLPDSQPGSEAPKGGTVNDSVNFILENFIEMNKLWVRMQHQGLTKDREKREVERQELRLLVGKTLARLSQLDGLDVKAYRETVLPRILEQVVHCKDHIAQQYLMESVIIQVFPDDFHLRTLDIILECCTKLRKEVDIKAILVSLMDRLCRYVVSSGSLPTDLDIFAIFDSNLDKILTEAGPIPLDSVLALLVSLLGLSLKAYPENVNNVNTVLHRACTSVQANATGSLSDACCRLVVKLLGTALTELKNVLVLLKLDNYPRLLNHLPPQRRKRVAIDFVQNALANNTRISDVEDVKKFMEFVAPLLSEEEDESDADFDVQEFEEEQILLASTVHLLHSDDPENLFGMYVIVRKQFGQGGRKSLRIRHLLPPLVFSTLRLICNMTANGTAVQGDEEVARKVKRLFKFVHETCTALARLSQPELALRLFLQCALCANMCAMEVIAYEFLTQAITLYENDITDSKAQAALVNMLTGTVSKMTCFSDENYDTLVTKIALHSCKLLRKEDQTRAVACCSMLFWGRDQYTDNKRVLECLQKAMKIADSVMESEVNIRLFIVVLSYQMHIYAAGQDVIQPKQLSQVISLIRSNLAGMDANDVKASLNAHFQACLQHMKGSPAFSGVEL